MSSELVQWWIGELRDSVPRRLRLVLARPQPGLIMSWQPPRLALAERRRDGSIAALGSIAAEELPPEALRRSVAALAHRKGGTVVLHPDPASLLSKTLELPLAARTRLAQLFAFELERETPFTLDEIHWRHVAGPPDLARQMLPVTLHIVPRVALSDALALAASLGVTPRVLELAPVIESAPGGEPLTISLGTAPAPAGGLASVRQRLGRAAPGLIAAGLAAALLVAPAWRQSQDLAAAEAAVTALAPEAEAASTLRRAVEAQGAAARFIAEKRQAYGDPLAILAALTDAIPDEAFLNELTLTGEQLTVSGEAPAATRIIETLAAVPGLGNPAFAAPVVRAPGSRQERFTIAISRPHEARP